MKMCRGTEHHSAKLDEDRVREIRRARETEVPTPTYAVLGRRFGVSLRSAWQICNYQTWKHVR